MPRGVTVDFKANTARFSKGTDKAIKDLNKFDKKAKKTGLSVGKMFAGLGAGLAARALIGGIRDSIASLDKLGKAAKVYGFTTAALQEYRFVAEQSGVATTQFDANMVALTKRLGEAKSATGPLVSFLKKYDTQLLKNLQSTNSTEEALGLVLEAIDKTTVASEKAAIANAAFSRSGVAMVNMAKDADKLREQAQRLGIVIDKDLVAQAEDASDQLNIMNKIISANLTRAFSTLAPVIIDVGKAFGEAAPGIAAFVRELFNLEDTSELKKLDDQIFKLTQRGKLLADRFRKSKESNIYGVPANNLRDLRKLEKQLAAILDKRDEFIRKRDTKPFTPPPDGGPGGGGSTTPAKAAKVAAAALGEMNDAHIQLYETMRAEGLAIFAETRTELENYLAAVKRVGELFESGAIEDIDVYHRKLDQLAEAFAGVTSKADETAEELNVFAEAAARNIQDNFADFLFDPFNDGLDGMLAGFTDMLRRLAAEVAAQEVLGSLFGEAGGGAGLLGEGGLGAIIGGLFSASGGGAPLGDLYGPGFAAGGRPPVGVPSLVGEDGPELFVPDRSGVIVPNNKIGGNTTINNISIAAPNGRIDRESLSQLQAVLARASRAGGRNL